MFGAGHGAISQPRQPPTTDHHFQMCQEAGPSWTFSSLRSFSKLGQQLLLGNFLVCAFLSLPPEFVIFVKTQTSIVQALNNSPVLLLAPAPRLTSSRLWTFLGLPGKCQPVFPKRLLFLIALGVKLQHPKPWGPSHPGCSSNFPDKHKTITSFRGAPWQTD